MHFRVFCHANCVLAALLITEGAVSAAPEVSNRMPQITEVGYLPPDGDTADTNPPALAWLPEPDAVSYQVELSPDPRFAAPGTIRAAARYVLYTHTETLPAGVWHWRYRFLTEDGKTSTWSQVRRFTVSEAAVAFPRLSSEEARARVPKAHPRLFLRPEEVAGLRAASQGALKERWETLRAEAEKHLKAPLIPEPPAWTDGKWNATEWRRNYSAAVRACGITETLAFCYLVSQEPRFGEAAARWLRHIAAWDPAGSTSIRVNDEAGMPILHVTSRAYTWAYEALSEEDRQTMRAMIRARGEEAYRRLHDRPYEQRAYDSHAGRMWHFLGEAAIAYYGEVPEAEKWLDYALTIFYGWYPVWADEDGGWSEGVSYWTSYSSRVTWWLDVARSALGIEGTEKPYYSRIGDYGLYIVPPGAPQSGFGDFSETAPTRSVGTLVNYFADARRNPYWKWYAEQWKGTDSSGVIGFLRAARQAKVESKPPTDLPKAKLFRGIGWAALHTDLTDTKNDVSLLFRSSGFGTHSHAHADQNGILLSAYGAPLLVNTGTRPWYGSPFCKEWYWATRAHNCVLIGGEGQIDRSRASVAKITAFHHGSAFDYVAGDATPAYGDRARRVLRQILFVRPNLFVIRDRIEAARPTTFQWLMHTRSPLDIEGDTARVEHQGARLVAHFVLPHGLKLSQTDRYPIEPEMGKTVPEWHFTAETTAEASAVDFLTVLSVARAGEPDPITFWSPLPAEQGVGVRFRRGDEVLSIAFAGEEGRVRAGHLNSDGEVVALLSGPDGTPRTAFIGGGRTLYVGDKPLIDEKEAGAHEVSL